MTKRLSFTDFNLRPLPTETIYRVLGIEVEDGNVTLSRGAQFHAHKRHPEDFNTCLPFVGAALATPSFLGDDFSNPDKIEFYGPLPGHKGRLLVAVLLERDDGGNYHVVSFYPVSRTKLDNRRAKNRIKPV